MTILLIYFLLRYISYGHVRFSHINYSPIRFKSHSYRNYENKFNNLHLQLLCKDFDNSIIDEHCDDNDDDETIILQTIASPPITTTSTFSTSNPLKQLICHFHCDDINSEEISELLFEAGCLSGTLTTTAYLPPY
jgi:hypothetical protein